MSAPKLYFYDGDAGGTKPQLALMNFVAASGSGSIKAGDPSKMNLLQIWNAPDATRAGQINEPTNINGSEAGWNTDATVSAAENVDVTTRDKFGGTGTTGANANAEGTDVVQGRWLNVKANRVGSDTNDPSTGFRVGYASSTEYATKIGDISRDDFALVQLTLYPPGSAAAGAREFNIRVSYSFQ